MSPTGPAAAVNLATFQRDPFHPHSSILSTHPRGIALQGTLGPHYTFDATRSSEDTDSLANEAV